ncbi:MAG: selenide, water dikinase SelD [Burkholderiaceae bacterium]
MILTPQTPTARDVVLVGGGHAHVQVLRAFAMRPMPGVRVTLLASPSHTPYSGMLPGYIAGHHGFDEVHIDLRQLAQRCGARFIGDEAVGLDQDTRHVHCARYPDIRYDVLSINIGSSPNLGGVPGASSHAIAVKPIAAFNQAWQRMLATLPAMAAPGPITVVGGGAGGVELVLAMAHRLRHERERAGHNPQDLRFALVTSSDSVLPTHNARVRSALTHILQQQGIALHTAAAVTQVQPDHLQLSNGTTLPSVHTLWATQAVAAPWLQHTHLALDEQGFIQVQPTLQTLNDERVFAVGDVASLVTQPLAKAGVFAVRMGQPLARNLQRVLQGKKPQPYRPQTQWLALLGTGPRHAVASRGRWFAQGAWVWHWKVWLDRRFMRRFTHMPAMGKAPSKPLPETASHPTLAPHEQAALAQAQAMRCGGCAAKVGADILSRALHGLQPVARPEVLAGLDQADDAAVLALPAQQVWVQSVDFFRAFTDDPFVLGQVAANHALGDLYAMGATPHSAQAIVTLPPGLPEPTEDTLRLLMHGALQVLNQAHCTLVGGHTAEGVEVGIGFVVNGTLPSANATGMRQNALQPGQALVLTKPLGTGVLWAAHGLGQGVGRWLDEALDCMRLSNQQASAICRSMGATACTDVTGFGLLGHAHQMAQASRQRVAIWMNQVPALSGALECFEQGLHSSLQPANERRVAAWAIDQALPKAYLQLGLDPQTAGGLLASVPAGQAAACVLALRHAGYTQAAIVGEVLAPQAGAPLLQVGQR